MGKRTRVAQVKKLQFLSMVVSHFWISEPKLPRPVDGASAAIVNGKIIQTGGYGIDGTEVRVYCPPMSMYKFSNIDESSSLITHGTYLLFFRSLSIIQRTQAGIW